MTLQGLAPPQLGRDVARVLLVDDRDENLLALEGTLEDMDLTLVRARSGHEALRLLLGEEFALILLDVQMPEMDGYETAQLVRARAKTAHVPIIFVSAIDREEHHALRGYGLGAVDFLAKPFNPDVLRAKVAVFVELFRLREAHRHQAEALAALNEELCAANEELTAQGEELQAQSEELQAQSEALHEQHRALEKADQLKDQFLGILSHELRTPLNAIQGFGSVLEDGIAGPLNEPQARFVGKILASSDAMLALVDDLLDLSRVQVGKFTLDRALAPATLIARAAIAQIEATTAAKGLAIVDDVPDDLPVVDVDPARVGQVLANLLTNAAKFTPPGGRIAVRAAATPGAVRFEVADDGEGIPPEEHDRIFVPFTQVDMSNTRQRGGVGLGLSIVRAIVHAHGGDVGVASEVGRGSTFWFTLPLARSTPPAPSAG